MDSSNVEESDIVLVSPFMQSVLGAALDKSISEISSNIHANHEVIDAPKGRISDSMITEGCNRVLEDVLEGSTLDTTPKATLESSDIIAGEKSGSLANPAKKINHRGSAVSTPFRPGELETLSDPGIDNWYIHVTDSLSHDAASEEVDFNYGPHICMRSLTFINQSQKNKLTYNNSNEQTQPKNREDTRVSLEKSGLLLREIRNT